VVLEESPLVPMGSDQERVWVLVERFVVPRRTGGRGSFRHNLDHYGAELSERIE
jgi:hypothetical protein